MRLANRTAIITGGANGIGRAAVERFVAEGARLAIWDMDDESGLALESAINEAAGSQRAAYYPVDVTDPDAVEAAAQQALKAWGRVDILINNAGILRDAQLIKYQDDLVLGRMSLKQFDDVINVNLRGVFVCTRAIAPIMIQQRYGRIITTSSIVGVYGNFGQTNYAASKAGVIGMTRPRELGRYNITVNTIAAGASRPTWCTRCRQVLEMMVARNPLKRLGKPEEIATAFLFWPARSLLVTGPVLSVDGGTVIGT
jgi:3-oxoacyl-[acyl-carrier protein] reductase